MSEAPDGPYPNFPLTLSQAGGDGGTGFLIPILILILLTMVNAFFSASEIAVITLNDAKIEHMAEEGNKKAKKIRKLTQSSGRFLSTIQIGITLAGFLSSAAASQNFAGALARALFFLHLSPSITQGLSTVIITLLLSYFSLVFGELVPKKIAMQRAEELSFRFVGALDATATVFRPLISLLTSSTNAVLRLMGTDPNASEETVTEEQILMMVDAGQEKGVLNKNEKDMISNIFDFSDSTAGEAMTHRTDVVAAEDTESVGDVIALSIEGGYSRIPVYHEDLDSVLGIIYVKDLLKFVGKPVADSLKLTELMRPAYFIPKSKPCSELFSEMTARRLQIAIVVDEYGGTEGIITMEDLLESIVGNMQDEYDHEEEEIRREGENRFLVDGSAPVDEISDMTGTDIPSGDYDTVAGLMMERLGRIPKQGEHPKVKLGNLTLTVLDMEERRIARILIEKEPNPENPEEPEEE